MKTLRMLTVGMLFGATAVAATAAEEPSVPTITVTAKRHATVPATERVAPRDDVQITFVMPTDMPEAEIDSHLTPIGAPPAPSVEG
jgi:hypothetical protein